MIGGSATEDLPRLLALVPWLLARPGSAVGDVATEFGVTEDQLREDLTLLWMCGVPGYGPGDLMDVVWDGDRVTLRNADEIARPLRLTAQEAVTLVAALRALSAAPGITDADAVDRALGKLEAAAASVLPTRQVVAAADADAPAADADVTARVTDALARGRRLSLRYWVPSRDEVTERDVDPLRVVTGEGASYLVGWCHLVEDLRVFRLDRVLAAQVLDAAADPPPEARPRALDRSLFEPDESARLVTLALDPAARWVADYHPCERVEVHDDSTAEVDLRVQDDAWAVRLVLSLAGHAHVVAPGDLAATVRAAAAAALAGYDDPS